MATPQPLVIFGIGDFADMVYFYFKHDPAFQVKAFTVDSAYIKEPTFHGLPVVPFETVEKEYPPSQHKVFIAMGYTDMNRRRAKRFELVRAKGYTMANYIHPTASIPPDLIMGENCFLMEYVGFQPFCKIGNGVVAMGYTGFGHDGIVGDFCFITGFCSIAAMVEFGPYCFISLNATFRPKVKVGHSCIIGSGALILKDVPDEGVCIAKGTPLAPRSSRFYQKFI